MIKITVLTTHLGSEIIADLMYEYSRAGVVIEDSEDVAELWNSTLVWDYLDDAVVNRPKEVRVTGYYDGEYSEISDDIEKRIKRIREECPDALPAEIIVEKVQDEDWSEDWKKFYQIIDVGDLTVAPIWKKDEVKEGRKVVLIDPGSAFGTGEHESTRLCLSLMNDLDLKGKNVVDTGCGSGILGIAALKSGAESCLFRDIDESALNNLRENMALNGVCGKVECASLLEGLSGRVDLVLANITADILSAMTNASSVVKKDGYLIMSGIIDKFEAPLVAQFEKMGFSLDKRLIDGIWVGLRWKKN